MKELGKRQKQFASVLRSILAQNIQSIVPQNFQSPHTLFSIGRVIVSADLRNAKVEVVCSEESREDNLKKLARFAPIIRKKSAPFLHTKYVPEIRFVRATCFESKDFFEKSLGI